MTSGRWIQRMLNCVSMSPDDYSMIQLIIADVAWQYAQYDRQQWQEMGVYILPRFLRRGR